MLLELRETIANFVCPEQRNERRNLSRLVNLDALTGLANRRAFELALPAAESDPNVWIVIFDINNAGQVNKKAGHKFGDIIIREVADVITRSARVYSDDSAERCFRIGGDEFVVLIERERAARLRDQVEISFGVKYPGIEVSVSGTFGETFAQADEGLQERKAAKKAKGTKYNG